MSTRKQAIIWWNNINGTFQQKHLGLKYYPNRNGLTGREIENIWKQECKYIENDVFSEKPVINFDNFKFKCFINNFSQENKAEMLQILIDDLGVRSLVDKSLLS